MPGKKICNVNQGAVTSKIYGKTSLKKWVDVPINYFSIIPTHSICSMWLNCPGAEFVGTEYKSRKRRENSLLCVHILHNTVNVVIWHFWFAEDGKEMYQNAKCMCRAIIIVLLIKHFILWRSRFHRRCGCLRSLIPCHCWTIKLLHIAPIQACSRRFTTNILMINLKLMVKNYDRTYKWTKWLVSNETVVLHWRASETLCWLSIQSW